MTKRALRLPIVAVIVVGMVAAASLALARPSQPEVTVRAQWLPASVRLPTAVAWYADGTREDLTLRLGESWRPQRPVRLVTVSAEVGCEIWAAGELVAQDRTADARYAVCAWMP